MSRTLRYKTTKGYKNISAMKLTLELMLEIMLELDVSLLRSLFYGFVKIFVHEKQIKLKSKGNRGLFGDTRRCNKALGKNHR